MIVVPASCIGETVAVATFRELNGVYGTHKNGTQIAVFAMNRVLGEWQYIDFGYTVNAALCMTSNFELVQVDYWASDMGDDKKVVSCLVNPDKQFVESAQLWMCDEIAEMLILLAPHITLNSFLKNDIARVKQAQKGFTQNQRVIIEGCCKGTEQSSIEVRALGEDKTEFLPAVALENVKVPPSNYNLRVLAAWQAQRIDLIKFWRNKHMPMANLWIPSLLYPKEPLDLLVRGSKLTLLPPSADFQDKEHRLTDKKLTGAH